MSLAPSGEQFEISHGDHRAVVVSVGGGVREYLYNGRAVLDGYPPDRMADGARGQSLIPWPNRVQDGKWSWQGDDMQLSLTEPSQHNAIHGLLRWSPWSAACRSENDVELVATTYPQPGYPWQLDVSNTWSLGDAGLEVTTTITNRSDSPAPVAAGFHPYITVGTPTIDAATLQIPAATRLPTGEQQIPTGREAVDGTDFDFREPRRLGDMQIDHTFTDLHRGSDGRFRLVLSSDDTGSSVTFWVDEAYAYVEVFTGDALPDSERRRRGLGVEPMSVPPNALVTGESLVVLEPEQTWTGGWGLEPR